jgi:O-antigen/teichoic acid export membrane protein
VSDICHGVMQQKEQLDRLSQSLMLKGLLSLAMLGLGIVMTGNLLVGSLCLIASWLVVLLVYDLPSCQQLLRAYPSLGKLWPLWQWSTLRSLLWMSLPLGLVMMLISLNTNIPRYFIEGALGERELGIFSALAYLMIVGSMIVNALGNSASPRLARHYAEGDRPAFVRLAWQMIAIGAVLGSAAVGVALAVGKPLLTLIYRPEYAEQSLLLVWLMVAAGLGYVGSFLGHIVSAARYFRVQVPLFILVTCVSAIACWWLLPQYQLLGAAYALVLSATVQLLISLGVFAHALARLKP